MVISVLLLSIDMIISYSHMIVNSNLIIFYKIS